MSETSVRPEGALTESSRGLSRRQVVKAGAWAAPVVVLTAAVPAAVASVKPSLSIYNISAQANWTNTNPDRISNWTGNSQVGVGYLAPNVSVTSITLTLVFDKKGFGTTTPTVTGAGWAASVPVIGGQTASFKFTWTGTANSISSGQTSQLSFTLPGDNANRNGIGTKTVSATATATNATTGSLLNQAVANTP